jgi:hypothetical protein
MKKSTKKQIDYRALKKALSKYFDFSFKLHAKRKVTPQQKSAITRKFQKIYPYIDGNFNPLNDEVTFIKYPKGSTLPNIDGIRTDAGIFYKWPQAELIKNKDKKNSYTVVVAPKILKGATLMEKRRDYFYPFPKSIIDNIDKIKIFVDKLKEKYNPQDIMWSTRDLRERQAYMPETFDLYFSPFLSTLEKPEKFLFDATYIQAKEIEAIKESEKSEESEESEEIKEPTIFNDIDNMTDGEILDNDDYNDLNKHDQAQLWKVRKMRQKHAKKDNYYNGVFLIYYLN